MYLSPCQHPKYITNPYTGKSMMVGCGKCPSCLSRRSAEWVSRLEAERNCWPYTVFFTLTYANEYLPKLVYNRFDRSFVSADRLVRYRNSKGVDVIKRDNLGIKIPFEDWSFGISEADYDYVMKRPWISHGCVSDIQKFIKRFRYYAKQYDSGCVCRYYISQEYGPTTFRSHYHGEMFLSSAQVAKHIDEILYKSWRLSDYPIDWSFVESTAASYVASYSAVTSNLPSIFNNKAIRPFKLFSKSPVIGSLFYNDETVLQMFHKGATGQSVPKQGSVSLSTVPLWRSFENRLFPKCVGYSRLSDFDRKLLYTFAKDYTHLNFDEFKYGLDHGILVSPCFNRLFTISVDLGWNDDTFRRVFNLSRRVCLQSSIFGVSPDYYVSRINLHYENKEKNQLKSQLEFEENNSFELDKLVSLDPVFCEYVYNSPPENISRSVRLTLDSFGLTPEDIKSCPDKVGFHTSTDFVNMSAKHNKIFNDSHKTKAKKDYMCKHPELKDFYYHG